MMIKNKRRKSGVIEEEMHVCGGRCMGEGGLEADEVGCLGRWGGMDVGEEEVVVAKNGVHGDFEVGDG
jgi:hypothetical protein